MLENPKGLRHEVGRMLLLRLLGMSGRMCRSTCCTTEELAEIARS